MKLKVTQIEVISHTRTFEIEVDDASNRVEVLLVAQNYLIAGKPVTQVIETEDQRTEWFDPVTNKQFSIIG